MNKHEQAVADALQRKGWTVLHRGWPDLLCVSWTRPDCRRAAESKNGLWSVCSQKPLRAFAVELKCGSDKETEHQQFMHVILRAAGIPCAVAREDDLEPLLRKQGTMFTFPEGRQELLDKTEKLQREVEAKSRELADLRRTIEASTVLFDNRDPVVTFEAPGEEGGRLFEGESGADDGRLGVDYRPCDPLSGSRAVPIDPSRHA